MQDLQIGAEILRETLDRELTKEERAAQAKKEEKAVAAAQLANVRLRAACAPLQFIHAHCTR